MKLEQQVVSLELAQKLKELGVKQESLFYWYYVKNLKSWEIFSIHEDVLRDKNDVSAFTVAELGEMLLDKGVCVFSGFGLDGLTYKWFCTQMSLPEFEPWSERWQEADTEADARAKMLVYLLENKLITL